MSPCHGEDRGFESHRGRQIHISTFIEVFLIVQLEEGLKFPVWFDGDDSVVLYPNFLKQASGEPVPLGLVGIFPSY